MEQRVYDEGDALCFLAMTVETRVDQLGGDQLSRRRRFALLAGLGAADELDNDWPPRQKLADWQGGCDHRKEPDRRRADTVALACAFRIPAEGFAVAGFAADLVGAATVFFVADRVGAIVFF